MAGKALISFEESSSTSSDLFANFGAPVRSWYALARSAQVRRGQVRSVEFCRRRIALWRDYSGVIHVIDARCPHLGADLGAGRVVENGLRCGFHFWTFGPDGRCEEAYGQPAPSDDRCAKVYPVMERFGLVWFFNGSLPTFALPNLPEGEKEDGYRRVYPPPRHISCHPHLVIGNGLDASHFETLHGFRNTAEPLLEQVSNVELTLRLQGRPISRLASLLLGTRKRDLVSRFTTVGASFAWATVEFPYRFHMLFSVRPAGSHGCLTRTVLFLPRGVRLSAVRAVFLMAWLLWDDSRILRNFDFHPGFTERDEPLRRFAELVNKMEVE